MEFGPPELDLGLRFRAHALMEALARDAGLEAVDLTPGVRSLQIHFNPRKSNGSAVLDRVKGHLADLPATEEIEVPSRIVRLPLAWDHSATRLAISRYQEVVRKDAPWCPSNIEFIRRINGLSSEEAVRNIVYDASYMVLGLGDVYLGAPVATPVDPRHRLVTTKYNPARTWTPENAVGIGGAYMCIYGMEGPGGYQFVGRTLQVWSRWAQRGSFQPGRPWLLRFFDQIQYYPVAEEELEEMRASFLHGEFEVETVPSTFRMREHKAFLSDHAGEIEAFKAQRQEAFDAERARWSEDVLAAPQAPAPSVELDNQLPEGMLGVYAQVQGSVWSLPVREGDLLSSGASVAVLESMKMEIDVPAPAGGRLARLCVRQGQVLQPGDLVAAIDPKAE